MTGGFPLTLTLSPNGRGDSGARGVALLTNSLPGSTQAAGYCDSPLPSWERVRVRGAMRQNDLQTARARDLRQSMTEAERKLWFALRDRRFRGLKFRRQVPIGPFIVDFFCVEAKLVIEADGGQHSESPQDAARDAWLRAQGLVVLRLWNDHILRDLSGSLQRLTGEVTQ